MNPEERRSIIEALIFASDVPLTFSRVKEIIGDIVAEDFVNDIKALDEIYISTGRAFGITRIAGGVQLTSKPEYANWIRRLLAERLKSRLSRPALESLAIIAYRQPITRVEVEMIRGVDCGGVIGTLLERGLITVSGRATTPGRPLLYITTQDFLRYFGLNEIEDLPKIRELQGLVEGDPRQVIMAFDDDKKSSAEGEVSSEATVEEEDEKSDELSETARED